jgi:hypothetical protein
MDEKQIRRFLRDAWSSLDEAGHPAADRQYHRSRLEQAANIDAVRRAVAELCAEAVLLGIRLPGGDSPDAFGILFHAILADWTKIRAIAMEESGDEHAMSDARPP